ncbi:MAG: hypothetical protein Q8L39_15680 [Burkholderiales bacterium]|nr:hypothetical protein [Burkholderiales bacterium]
MYFTPHQSGSDELSFESLNWRAADNLPRDRDQSHRLHEPGLMISSVDPMTGMEIEDLSGHPYIVDGNMVIYFETDATRQAFQDMPIDHPFHLIDNPYEEGEAEG